MMKNKFLLFVLSSLLLVACGPNREKQLKNIEEKEQSLSTFDMISEDTDLDEMLTLYRNFAHDFPNDSLAPVFLLRAADISISMSEMDQAIDLLDSIINLYPGFEDLGGCWFNKGRAYEELQELDKSREAYSYFVNNFPDHPLAKDTRFQLENNLIGMSPEDQLEAVLKMMEN